MKIRSKPYPKTVKSGWNIITIKIILLHTPYPRKLGQSSCGALINLQGWSEVEFVQTEGLHPVSNKCSVINAATTHSG